MTEKSNDDDSIRIPDDAFVVRGGQNRVQDIQRGMAMHPSGIVGVSVESADSVTIEDLSIMIPHRQIGITTAREVRKVGGDVVRTSGRSLYHATLTGLTPDVISELFTPTIINPIREQK